jgi:hypothetical protein
LIYDVIKRGGLNLKVMVTTNLINYILYHGKEGGCYGWAGACHKPGSEANVTPLGTDALKKKKERGSSLFRA